MPLSEEDEWIENMLDNIAKLEEKYGTKSKSVCVDGVIFSAEVTIPMVDFSKVKPNLHRNKSIAFAKSFKCQLVSKRIRTAPL